ncbi:MAG: low molecular weight phosphotyrosine protein phosphatase [Sulfurimonas sp.]|nr:MAG: low molecular weight phosphotyrosine protein phosphatase [Sulfurimonas sp.]
MKSIIFVCLGNICRSPIAEGCAKKLAQENKLNLKIESSGTGSWHIGEAPCDNSIKVCKSHNINISKYKGSQFTKADINSYDLVVALDNSNYNDLKALGVSSLVKLGDYGYNSQDVPDPYFFDGFKGFEEVYEMINTCVDNLFNELKI